MILYLTVSGTVLYTQLARVLETLFLITYSNMGWDLIECDEL